jgi:hypothetical protein
VEGLGPILLVPDATLTDTDSPDYAGGSLTASFVTGSVDDRLSIRSSGDGPGQIRVFGIQVLYEGNYIGDVLGGSSLFFPLTVTFRTNAATPTAIQALLRALQYDNVSQNPSPTPRVIRILLDDGDPLSEVGTLTPDNPIEVVVGVTGVNDPRR